MREVCKLQIICSLLTSSFNLGIPFTSTAWAETNIIRIHFVYFYGHQYPRWVWHLHPCSHITTVTGLLNSHWPCMETLWIRQVFLDIRSRELGASPRARANHARSALTALRPLELERRIESVSRTIENVFPASAHASRVRIPARRQLKRVRRCGEATSDGECFARIDYFIKTNTYWLFIFHDAELKKLYFCPQSEVNCFVSWNININIIGLPSGRDNWLGLRRLTVMAAPGVSRHVTASYMYFEYL